MASAALSKLETLLAARKLDGTVARPDAVRMPGPQAPTGIAALDDVLQGGWRRGEVSEVIGGPSTGRTGVVCATLAAATARGEIVGVVDAFDRLDPVTMAATGVDLSRVLWVRGPALTLPGRQAWSRAAVTQAVRALDLIIRAGGFGVVVLDVAGGAGAGLSQSGAGHLAAARACDGRSAIRRLAHRRCPDGPERAGCVVAIDLRQTVDGARVRKAAGSRASTSTPDRTRATAHHRHPSWTLRAAV
jgi:hypothetical protein